MTVNMPLHICSIPMRLKRAVNKGVLFYVFLGLLVSIFLLPVFKPGYLTFVDNPYHHFEMEILSRSLLPIHHWINGWSHQSYMGYPVLLYQPQLGFWLVIILQKLFFISLVNAYKVALVSSLWVLCSGLYMVTARRFGKKAGLFAALLVMLQKDIYYDKILAGMWSNYLSIGILIIFIDLMERYSDRLTVKKCLILGLIFGLIILGHLNTAIFGSLIFPILLCSIWAGSKWRGSVALEYALKYGLIFLVGISVSLFYLYPFLETGRYFPLVSFTDPPLGRVAWALKGLFGGFSHFFDKKEIFSMRGTDILKIFLKSSLINYPLLIRDAVGMLGIAFFMKYRKGIYPDKRFLAVIWPFMILALLLHSNLLNLIPFWRNSRFAATLQPNRLLIYAQLGLFIFAGYGFSMVFKVMNKWKMAALVIIFSLLGASFFAHRYIYVPDGAKTTGQVPAFRQLEKCWAWISENVRPDDGRVVYQNTLGNSTDPSLARSHILSLSGLYTQNPQLGGFSGPQPQITDMITRTDNKAIFGKNITLISAPEIAEKMNDFNSRYLVTCEPLLSRKLLGSILFERVAEYDPFSIFRLKVFRSGWIEFGVRNTPFSVVGFGDQLIVVAVKNSDAGNWIRIKMTFHPYWKAEVNGEPASVIPGDNGLIEILLKETGSLNLRLSYDPIKKVPIAISIFSLIAALGMLVLPFKKSANEKR